MVAIAGLNTQQIRLAVRRMYGDVARRPQLPFHFPTGREASRVAGYPEDWLEDVPEAALESFAGVGCPFRAEVIREGDRVLDIGAGAGTDSFVAARQAGPTGRVVALDMTPEMVAKLSRSVEEGAAANIEVVAGSAESIPLPDASIDVVTSNGVVNLIPDKRQAFAEMYRVLRPGGHAQIADVVISRALSARSRTDPQRWAECVVGAVVEEDYLSGIRAAGFVDVEVLRRHDYFSASRSAETRELASALGARAVELRMRKPARAISRVHTWLQRMHPRTLARRATQHGTLGLFATGAALAACYGLLALVALLAMVGVAVPLDNTVWAATIVVLVALVPLALAWNFRAHRQPGPLVVSCCGAAMVAGTLLLAYDWRVEATGFVILLGAALWDWRLYRYVC